jgi:hypothetical protein
MAFDTGSAAPPSGLNNAFKIESAGLTNGIEITFRIGSAAVADKWKQPLT